MTIAATPGPLPQPITLKLTPAQDKMFAEQIEAALTLCECEQHGFTLTMQTREGASALLNRMFSFKPKTGNEYRVWDAATTKLTLALRGDVATMSSASKPMSRKTREALNDVAQAAQRHLVQRCLSPQDRLAADVAWGEAQRAKKAAKR